MSDKKLSYLQIPGNDDKYKFSASYINGKDVATYMQDAYMNQGIYAWANLDNVEYCSAKIRVSSEEDLTEIPKGYMYFGQYLDPKYFIGSALYQYNTGYDSGLPNPANSLNSTPIIITQDTLIQLADQSCTTYGEETPILVWVPYSGVCRIGTLGWEVNFPKPGIWVLNFGALIGSNDATPMIVKIDRLYSTNSISPTTYYASTPAGGSDYSFATVFDNDYLERLTGQVYYPKDGDALIVPEMNAIYKYIPAKVNSSDNIRVYVYQAYRGTTNIANKESVAELVGNFTCEEYNSRTRLTKNLADYNQTSVYNENLWNGATTTFLQDPTNPIFSTYAGIPGNSTKKTPLLFKDSSFNLVAHFTLNWNKSDNLSTLIKNHLNINRSNYPLLKYDSAYGGITEGTIYIIEMDGVKFSNNFSFICSNKIDNGLAIEAYNKNLKNRSILFEFWNGDCWFEGNDGYNYLVAPIKELNLTYNRDDYTVTFYWTEEWGNEGFDLKIHHNLTNPLILDDTYNRKYGYVNLGYSIGSLFTMITPISNSLGYWVYEKPITDESYRPTTNFYNSSVPYAFDGTISRLVLNPDAKLGDLIFAKGGMIWRCDGCYVGKNKQSWLKLYSIIDEN